MARRLETEFGASRDAVRVSTPLSRITGAIPSKRPSSNLHLPSHKTIFSYSGNC